MAQEEIDGVPIWYEEHGDPDGPPLVALHGGILTFEGFEPLGANLRLLDIFYKLGLRMATLTHSRRNYFADGTQAGVRTTGLTEAGLV